MQYIISGSFVQSESVQKVVKSEARLLFHAGTYLQDALRQEHIPARENRQALRSEGIGSLESVAAIGLETNGDRSILTKNEREERETLLDGSMPHGEGGRAVVRIGHARRRPAP